MCKNVRLYAAQKTEKGQTYLGYNLISTDKKVLHMLIRLYKDRHCKREKIKIVEVELRVKKNAVD
jgi:hypothetical protein